MGEDENTENRNQEYRGSPDAYIRRSTLLQTVGAFVGIVGAYFGIQRFFADFSERLERLIQNERVERINQDNRVQDRLDSCCRRR